MSEYNQTSFKGGMNLIYDDTRIGESEYREGFNIRNRFDVLDQIQGAAEIISPPGPKQGLFTFGDYLLLFVGGLAFYQFRDTPGWQIVPNFKMSESAPRVYVCVVPVNTTNYARFAVQQSDGSVNADAKISVQRNNSSAAFGNVSGLVVQNGIDQPWFIFVSTVGIVAKVTQKYTEWFFSAEVDKREYVPVGTFMEWWEGMLLVVAPDFENIYRSVSGRPLDFVIDVDQNGQKAATEKGGGADVTSYSVGIGGITCIRAMSDGGLFVACSNVTCFKVTVDRSNNARTIFGEPTFIRQFLFNAGCMSDRTIVDILGDTAFIDLDGLRSFNAVQQYQNEGRNSVFSLKLAPIFKDITQLPDTTAAIVFDNYAMFGVNTHYGYVIVVYDTLNSCFSSLDNITQGRAVRQFAKIDTDVRRLYCITEDDRVLQLYAQRDGFGNPVFATSTVRLQSMCASVMYQDSTVKMQCPKTETRLTEFRALLSGYRAPSTVSASVYVDNRFAIALPDKHLESPVYNGSTPYGDIGSSVSNLMWTIAASGCKQGWKTFVTLEWTGGGTITNVYALLQDITPKNSLNTQANLLSQPSA